MYNQKSLLLTFLLIFCIGISMGSVFASDSSNLNDNFTTDETDSISLKSVENEDTVDNLSNCDDSDYDNVLSVHENKNSEVLSLKVNSSEDEVLSSGGHTYFVAGYKFTLSNKECSQLKNHKVRNVYVYTDGKYIVKVPKYKNKKVTKYKWKYKKVKYEAFKPYSYDVVKLANLNKYYKKGWKKHTQGFKSYKNQNKYLGYNYVVLKKKVSYTKTKKVKVGYKSKKMPVVGKVSVGQYDTPYIYFYAGNLVDYHWYKVLGSYSFNF